MGLVVMLVLLENTKDLCLYIHRGDLELSVYVIQKQVTSRYQQTRDLRDDQRHKADHKKQILMPNVSGNKVYVQRSTDCDVTYSTSELPAQASFRTFYSIPLQIEISRQPQKL
jgi:hypothetical protein